jgi:anthranilate phosphoribosyltransferase
MPGVEIADATPRLRRTLQILMERSPLDSADVVETIRCLLHGAHDDALAAAVLVAWRIKGETPAEIAAAVRTLRESMVPLDVASRPVLDTCGTGGDESGTFNISTATALVVAATGMPVVKHGNRSVSSRSGSADVLAELGVPIQAGPDWAKRCLEEHNFAFCFAPQFHPALAKVAPVRRALGVRTIFNLLGPLLNPARAEYQLIGVGKGELVGPIAEAMRLLGNVRTLVLHATDDGLDEISTDSRNAVELVDGESRNAFEWTAADFGLPRVPLAAIRADGPADSAAMIRQILDGRHDPARTVVLANAAAALWVARRCENLPGGVAIAAEAIDNGNAKRVLSGLCRT